MNFKVSVIIPNYNHERYLSKRIETVINQTYSNIEVIILDDCSTDNSDIIIKQYDDPRIRYYKNNQNSQNTFKQWQYGIQQSKGDLIWIAESDDFAELSFLEILVPYFYNSNTSIAYCQSYAVDEADRIKYSFIEWTLDLDHSRWNNDFCNNGFNELEHYFYIKNTIPNASAVLFRKQNVAKDFFSITDFKLIGDKVFWSGLLTKGNIQFCAKHLNYFRQHENTVRSSTKSVVALSENLRWYVHLNKTINATLQLKKNKRKVFIGWWYSLINSDDLFLFSSHNIVIAKLMLKIYLFSWFELLIYSIKKAINEYVKSK